MPSNDYYDNDNSGDSEDHVKIKEEKYVSKKKSEKERKKALMENIYSLFSHNLFAELYFAWSRDCGEKNTLEAAKYFRDELFTRGNKDMKNFDFHAMRVGLNFLLGFVSNLAPGAIKRVDLSDNLITDTCMHNVKSLISSKGVEYLNLASNMISTEGLKIIQNELMDSKTLKYLNLGIVETSFRKNNFSGEGGIILARVLITNESIETLILEDNELGPESAEKIGSSLIKNRTLKHLVITRNKIKDRGAKGILINASRLVSLNLAYNEISSEVCQKLYDLMTRAKRLKEIVWDGNNIGPKGIHYFIAGLKNGGRVSEEAKLFNPTSKHAKIKKLSLKNTRLDEQGLKALAEGLFENEDLEILDIGSNSITYSSFRLICDSLNRNKIRILRCKGNLLGDDSMRYFADNILSNISTSCLTSFDFSSCKIYDQGLVYLLNELQNNQKIRWINLKGNYFSNEIDFVILKFLEKNNYVTHFDVKKNRFSFQCMQKIKRIIQRNNKLLKDKEPNKKLVQYYTLKYENEKLNGLKNVLQMVENDNEKLKSTKTEQLNEVETLKRDTERKIEDLNREIEKNQEILNLRIDEYNKAEEALGILKSENLKKVTNLQNYYNEMLERKRELEEEIQKVREDTKTMEEDFRKTLQETSAKIEENKKVELKKKSEMGSLTQEKKYLEGRIKQKKEKLLNETGGNIKLVND